MTYNNLLFYRHFAKCRLPVYILTLVLASASSAFCDDASSTTSQSLAVSVSAPSSAHSNPQYASSRRPGAAFATEIGVYELDLAASGLRFWQRTRAGLEFRDNSANIKNGDYSFLPYTTSDIERLRRSKIAANIFFGTTSSGGVKFNSPTGLAKNPTTSQFAVVCGGDFSEGYAPSVQVYDFEETADSSGNLSKIEVNFAEAYSNAFHETTVAIREIDSIVSESFIRYDVITNGFITNFVHVRAPLEGFNVYVFYTNSSPVEESLLLEHEMGADFEYVDGNGWPYLIPKISTNGSTRVETLVTNYVTRFETVADASYLSSATDVAFLPSGGVVVSIAGEDNTGIGTGFIVFDSPDAEGVLAPVDGLAGPITGIDVDPDTGDVYAAVPASSAIYRFTASSLTGPISAGDASVITLAAGVEDQPTAEFGHLSNPHDVSVWSSASASSKVLLVADTANSRIHGFSADGGTPLFTAVSPSGNALNHPYGVYGVSGQDAIVVADTQGSRVLVWNADNLAELTQDDPDEPVEEAVYAVVFTAMSPTNLSFRVTCVSGTPAEGDTVTLHSSPDLLVPLADWPVATGASQTSFPVGADISAAGESADYGLIDISDADDSVFYSVHAP